MVVQLDMEDVDGKLNPEEEPLNADQQNGNLNEGEGDGKDEAEKEKYVLTKNQMDKCVTVYGGETSHGEKATTEKFYILDFAVFFNKNKHIDRALLEKIRDHWDPKIQSHLLVYMFTQTIAMRSMRSSLYYAEYLAMLVFTFLAGNLAYLVRYPTELHWGITDIYTMSCWLYGSLFFLIAVEAIQLGVYRMGYFKKWTNLLQAILILGSFLYIGIIPWNANLCLQKTNEVIKVLDSTQLAINVTHDMVRQKEICSLIKLSNGHWEVGVEESQTKVLQNFISERTSDAFDNFGDVVSNVTDVSYYLVFLTHDGFSTNNETIKVPYKFNFTYPNGTNTYYRNHQYLVDMKEKLKTTKEGIEKSVKLLKEILEIADLDEHTICLKRITKMVFHYLIIKQKLGSALDTFNHIRDEDDNNVFLHYSCALIFWMSLISFCLLEKTKTVSIYAIMLKKLFIKTVAMILFFTSLICAFANALRLLIDHRNTPFRTGFRGYNKVLAMLTGELEYTDTFQPGQGESNTSDIFKQLIFTFFIVVMVILVCNFLISITMNDLSEIRSNAVANQCKNILVDVLSDDKGIEKIETNMDEYFGNDGSWYNGRRACFQLCVEKNYFRWENIKYLRSCIGRPQELIDGLNWLINQVLKIYHDIKFETNRMSLWVYDDQTKEKKKMIKGGFLSIDTVRKLIDEDITKKQKEKEEEMNDMHEGA